MKLDNLAKDPTVLRQVRVALGFSQTKFAKYLGTKQSTLSALERGVIKTLSSDVAETYAKKLNKRRINLPSKTELRGRLLEIAQRGRFSGEYARKMALKAHSQNSIRSAKAQKLTPQETKIAEILNQNEVSYEIHPVIDAGGVSFVADFGIEKKGQKILIEAKDLKTKYRNKALICELAYRATRIKRFNYNTKMIAVIKGNLMQSERKILSDEFDAVFTENEVGKFVKFVNGLF